MPPRKPTDRIGDDAREIRKNRSANDRHAQQAGGGRRRSRAALEGEREDVGKHDGVEKPDRQRADGRYRSGPLAHNQTQHRGDQGIDTQ